MKIIEGEVISTRTADDSQSTALELSKPSPSFLFRVLPFLGKMSEGISRRNFESRLAKLTASALAHEQEKLAPGSDAYKRLSRMADEAITGYCLRSGADQGDLEAQIPAIRKMRMLADPPPARGRFGLFQIILGTGCLFAMTALIGLDSGLFVAARQFAIRHFLHS